ncbi:SPOR domain-containing protein [Algoriphagus mannitolivorans]|uniref:SPOR domain-containing protein n=1 Tax=Algoriphagus mannitolivorans TaxID=226504 RepID=UPI00041B786A|nr:SPOR domain-containing protein [Algoriphagus mannitolivorans]
MNRIWIALVILIIWGCKSTGSVVESDANSYANYQENLMGSLPEYPDFQTRVDNIPSEDSEVSVQAVDSRLDVLQRGLYEKNRSELYFTGYTVLVYSGVNRDQAFKTQSDLAQYFPEMEAEMQYQQPRYLVKVGKYAYKIEAQSVFSQIKGVFPSARIIPDRFQRKEYVYSNSSDSNAESQN